MASTGIAGQHRQRDEAPLGHAGDPRNHQPGRVPRQLCGEPGADQHDQRHHRERVDEQVAHVHQMPAGQQAATDRRAGLLHEEYCQHEPQRHRPGQLEPARVDGAG
jgi:hypothetical protein